MAGQSRHCGRSGSRLPPLATTPAPRRPSGRPSERPSGPRRLGPGPEDRWWQPCNRRTACAGIRPTADPRARGTPLRRTRRADSARSTAAMASPLPRGPHAPTSAPSCLCSTAPPSHEFHRSNRHRQLPRFGKGSRAPATGTVHCPVRLPAANVLRRSWARSVLAPWLASPTNRPHAVRWRATQAPHPVNRRSSSPAPGMPGAAHRSCVPLDRHYASHRWDPLRRTAAATLLTLFGRSGQRAWRTRPTRGC